MLYTQLPLAIHLLLCQSKPVSSSPYIKPKLNLTKKKKRSKNIVRAKTKQKKNIKRFPMSSVKHHMQKQIMAKQNVGQHVYDRSPEHTNLPSGMQHPLQVFPGAKPPNAHPTVPHDNDLTPRQPSHGGKIMIKKKPNVWVAVVVFFLLVTQKALL